MMRKSITILYTKKPQDSEHAFLHPGVVLLYKSEIFKALCELSDIGSGTRTKWSCKKKGYGRLHAQCSLAGTAAKPRGEGKRRRISIKVGCIANVTAVPLTARTQLVLLNRITDAVKALNGGTDEEDDQVFCVIQSVNTKHGSVPEPSDGEEILLSRCADTISHTQICSALDSFLCITPGGPGSLLKAAHFLSAQFPHIHIPMETIRNAVAKIRKCDDDALSLVTYLRGRKSNGDLDYLKIYLDKDAEILNSVVWAFAGSKQLVQRCGDIAFWDSTQNMTRYNYKISCFTIIDSEGRSRAALFGLFLSETAENCKLLLIAWHENFEARIPIVICTDGDEAMYAATESVPYSGDIKHLICVFHLFDINVEKRVQPLLTSVSCGRSWAGFRKGLSACREAQSAVELKRLWQNLLKEWIPSSPSSSSVLCYLKDYVWSKREQWAVTYFKTSFTCGASSTQRSESCNSLMKAFADTRTLASLFQSLQNLTGTKFHSESKTKHLSVRLAPFEEISIVTGRAAIAAAEEFGLSRFGCNHLRLELSAAHKMRVTILNQPLQVSEIADGMLFEGIVRYTYPNCDNDTLSQTMVKLAIRAQAEEQTLMNENSELDCDCSYTRRMKIPCRHA